MRAVLLLLPLLLSSCAVFAPDSGLLDRTWQVVELQGEPFLAPAGQAFTLTLQHDGRMQAYAGCNALTGIYQLKAGRGGQGLLRVGPFDLLDGLCAPEVAHLERKVIHTMEGASSYQLEADGTLALRNPIAITLIRFRARP